MPEISMVIPVGDGEKTVYLRMKDNVGNIAESAFDTIILDTTPPHSLTLKINNGSLETNSTKVWLEIRAQDEYSGVYQMSFSTNGDYWSPWQNYSTNRQYNLPSVDGNKTIYYMVKDRLGNQAEPVYETIILNTTVPVTNVEPQKEKISEVSSSTILIISSIAVIIIFLIIIIILIIQRKKKRSKNLTSMATVTVKPTQQTDLASTSASKPTLTSTSTSTNTPTIITKSTTSSLKIISTAHPPVFSEVSEAAEGDVCMTCVQQTNYIKDQNKYYCFHCKKYE